MKGREYGMSTKTEKELEQKYLDNVIDKVKQAEQKAEKKQKNYSYNSLGKSSSLQN